MFPPDRPNPSDLEDFDLVRAQTMAMIAPLAPIEVALHDALGRVLAETVSAQADIPPFDNSAMDGFAVRADDLEAASTASAVRLPIVGEVFAGPGALPQVRAATAVRIMTGGRIPPGADTVIPVEQLEVAWVDGVEVAIVDRPHRRGAHIRPQGDDVMAGVAVIEAGTVLDAAGVSMLASLGRSSVRVHPRPRVAVVATGDELVAPGAALAPGQIHDSNSFFLAAAVVAAGAEVVVQTHAADTLEDLRACFSHAASCADLVLTTGGVSVGDHDYTKSVLGELGDVRSVRVGMQPGMPQAFGRVGGAFLYGLPGNPVSTCVVFHVLVRPLLLRLAGYAEADCRLPVIEVELGEQVRSPQGKASFLRVRLEAPTQGPDEASPSARRLRARLTGSQSSGVLSSCVAADALAVIPASVRELAAGSHVQALVLRPDVALRRMGHAAPLCA